MPPSKFQANLRLVDNFQVGNVSDFLACFQSLCGCFGEGFYKNFWILLLALTILMLLFNHNCWARSTEIHAIGDTRSMGRRNLNYIWGLCIILPQTVAFEHSWRRCRKPRIGIFLTIWLHKISPSLQYLEICFSLQISFSSPAILV